jgi:hypothetical protein
MEMLGAITGLIGAGLQAKAQADQLAFQYAHFNWEKERAGQQDWFAQAARSDQYGNTTRYDPALNKWVVDLAPQQKEISNAQQREQLLQLTKDIPAARKVKEAVQQRAYDAKEPFLRASLGYQYDQPESEASIRSKITGLMATNDMRQAKANQASLIRSAIRLGQGGKASDIINSTDLALGDADRTSNRMLAARQDAAKEYGARVGLHEQMWGAPMKMWGDLMAQGGDIPPIPRSAMSDTTGAQQNAMLQAFNQGTGRVGAAFDSLAGAAGKSPDLSSVAKLLAGIGKSGGKGSASSKSPYGQDAEGQSSFVTDNSGDSWSPMSFSNYQPAQFDSAYNDYGTSYGSSLFG